MFNQEINKIPKLSFLEMWTTNMISDAADEGNCF